MTYGSVTISTRSARRDDDLLVLETAWPGTTLDGQVGIVSGTFSVSRSVNGQFVMNLAVGQSGGKPEDCEYIEFVLSREHANQLAAVLTVG
jgi:hypothetical protein